MWYIISNIYELDPDEIESYLIKRWLYKQYIKAKQNLLLWNMNSLDFKYRQPKSDWNFSFRINEQFRAFGFLQWEDFVIVEISNHSNF